MIYKLKNNYVIQKFDERIRCKMYNQKKYKRHSVRFGTCTILIPFCENLC